MSNLPPMPDKSYLGDDVSWGYDAYDMRDYAEEAVRLERERSNKLADALQELLNDSQHMQHEDCDDGGYCPVRDARQALRDFEARSEG